MKVYFLVSDVVDVLVVSEENLELFSLALVC
jgi:hypothetical protein